MRALIVSNMYPTTRRPALGSFVRDQVRALRRRDDLELELFTFEPGGAAAYGTAAAELRRRYRGERFDVVHAHFGLTLWPSLAVRAELHAVTLHGTDLARPRSRAITLAGLRTAGLPAVVSTALAAQVPGWAVRRAPALLPCGVDTERFAPLDRAQARRRLGLPDSGPVLLFPADPRRPEKRFDRARQVAGEHRLLALGATPPEEVPWWVNAADAVLVTSERESFGLAVLEALACGVPVLSTPVGVAPELLEGLEGTLCAPFSAALWREWLRARLERGGARIQGRERAERYSAQRMAARVVSAWQARL